MSARVPLPRGRDLFLMVPVGLLVLLTLRQAGAGVHGGPWSSTRHVPTAPVEGHDYALAALAVAAVGLRRWPVLAFSLATLATGLLLALGQPFGPVLLTVLITGFSLAGRAPLPRSAIAGGAGLLVLLAGCAAGAAARTGEVLPALAGALPLSAWVAVPFCAGLVRRTLKEGRARRRAEEERAVLDAERLRLASEVHDVVGHGLAAIRMQADIALHVADRRPEQARAALEIISRASGEALTELRATLAQIAPDAAEQDAHAPTPGLDRLGALCARMREAGIDVELEVHGERRPVGPAADVAAYRIVQESLTNVVKHAAERRATVRVQYAAEAVEVLVASAVAPGTRIVEGFGLAGIRRRAAEAGGRAEVTVEGERLDVRALLPYAR